MPPKSDPQRDGVYWLEAEVNGSWRIDEATRGLLRFACEKACNYYGVEAPRVLTINREPNGDAAWYLDGTIYINRRAGGANLHVLLHETAHHLVEEFYDDAEHHGPEFVGIYMHLLDKYCVLPHQLFRILAKKFKLKIGRKYRPVAFR
jgi:hypothetical protein